MKKYIYNTLTVKAAKIPLTNKYLVKGDTFTALIHKKDFERGARAISKEKK